MEVALNNTVNFVHTEKCQKLGKHNNIIYNGECDGCCYEYKASKDYVANTDLEFIHSKNCHRRDTNDKTYYHKCNGCFGEYMAMQTVISGYTNLKYTTHADRHAILNFGHTKESLFNDEYRIQGMSALNLMHSSEDHEIVENFAKILSYVNDLRNKVKTLEHENTQSKSKLE